MGDEYLCLPGDVSFSTIGKKCVINGSLMLEDLKHDSMTNKSIVVAHDGVVKVEDEVSYPNSITHTNNNGEQIPLFFPITDTHLPHLLVFHNGIIQFAERSQISKISAFAGLKADMKYGLHQRCKIIFDSFSKSIEHNYNNIMTEHGCKIPKSAIYRISCQVTLVPQGRLAHVGRRTLDIIRNKEKIATYERSPESCRDVRTMLSISGIVAKLEIGDEIHVVMGTLGHTPNTLIDSTQGSSFFSIEEV